MSAPTESTGSLAFTSYASMADVAESPVLPGETAPANGVPSRMTSVLFTAEDRRKIEVIRMRLGLKTMAGAIRHAVEVMYYEAGGEGGIGSAGGK